VLGTAIILQAAELVGWTGLWWKLKGDATKQILIHGRVQPQRIPIIDGQLKNLAGHPTKFQREASTRIVKLVRHAVNTRAFEYVTAGLMNPKSSMRKQLKTPPIVRVL